MQTNNVVGRDGGVKNRFEMGPGPDPDTIPRADVFPGAISIAELTVLRTGAGTY
jgi:hypothetical protein